MSDELTDGTEQPDPETDPFGCSVCGGPLSELEGVAGVEVCEGCRVEVAL